MQSTHYRDVLLDTHAVRLRSETMSDFLVIGSWTGRRKIPVKILRETSEGFQIEALERVLLPGRGCLEKGKSTFVSRSVIKHDEVSGS